MLDNIRTLTPPHKEIEGHFASVYIPLFPKPAIHVQTFDEHPRERSAEEIMQHYGDQLTQSLQ